MKRGDIVIGVNNDKVDVGRRIWWRRSAPRLSGWRLSFQREGKVFNLAIQG